jgi:hypothetical protein
MAPRAVQRLVGMGGGAETGGRTEYEFGAGGREGRGTIAGRLLRWGKLLRQNFQDLPAQGGDVIDASIPENLPIQIEVGMNDAMADSDSPPRDFGMAPP